MKKSIALVLAALPFLFSFIGDPESGQKSPPSCTVEYCRTDTKLGSKQARIEFHFRSDYLGVVHDSVLMSYNGRSQTLFPDSTGAASLVVTPGKYKFQFYIRGHEEIYTDSIGIKKECATGLAVYFSSTIYMIEADKPVIYFYPQSTTDVQVKLYPAGEFNFTYPAYNDGWNFTAGPSGKLKSNGKEYDYLFWDAQMPWSAERPQRDEGFVVERDSLTSFFEEKLTAMGLNAREQEDFITYWCPLMQKHEKCFVHFMFTREYDQVATIDITPKPDHIFRVFMIWEDASGKDHSKLAPQEMESVTREGFTVIEWGGSDLTNASCSVLSRN